MTTANTPDVLASGESFPASPFPRAAEEENRQEEAAASEQYTCPDPACNKTFGRKTSVGRHSTSMHGIRADGTPFKPKKKKKVASNGRKTDTRIATTFRWSGRDISVKLPRKVVRDLLLENPGQALDSFLKE